MNHPATFEAARSALIAAVRAAPPAEAVPLHEAAGRILAQALVSPIDLPPADVAAMDGHAFDGSVLAERQGEAAVLSISGRALAGQVFEGVVAPQACIRIMTGATLPTGTDTVVPLELAEAHGSQLHLPANAVRPGQHVRRRGAELQAGAPVLPQGHRLSAASVGLLAALGVAQVPCHRVLRVAVFSSGDELLAGRGQHDANRPMLLAALRQMGCLAIDLGIVADDAAALSARLQAALTEADVDAVIGSGGVSVGDADHTRAVLGTLGEAVFWQLPIRPGRPFAFCRAQHGGRDRWVFALPGNPAATWVSFHALLRPALWAMAGAAPGSQMGPVPCLLRTNEALAKRPGRTEFIRARVAPGPGGACVQPFAEQGAASLLSVAHADALIVLDHDRGPVAAGEAVPVWLFEGLS